jgi:tetratricopeptide (TPR) repeat protein
MFSAARIPVPGLLICELLSLPVVGLGQVAKTKVMPPSAYAVRWTAIGSEAVAPVEVMMEYDSTTATWTPIDSARASELFKERQHDWVLRTFGPDWPNIEEPIRIDSDETENAAYGFMEDGLVDSAVKVLRHALRTDQRNAPLACTVGDVYALKMRSDTTYYLVKKWFRKAEAAYQAALRLDRRSHRTNFNLGLLYTAYLSRLCELQLEDEISTWYPRDWETWMKAQTPLERAYLIDPEHQATVDLINRWYGSHGYKEDEKSTIKKRLTWQGAWR